MILREVLVPGKELKCERCDFIWVSIAKDLPEFCPNRDCRSREWNGRKKRIKPTRIELPKPTKVKQGEDNDYDF
jgi:hypothetical protein